MVKGSFLLHGGMLSCNVNHDASLYIMTADDRFFKFHELFWSLSMLLGYLEFRLGVSMNASQPFALAFLSLLS